MAAPHLPLKKRIKYILSKERKMDTKLKKSSAFLIGLVAVLITGFIIGHDWAFALEKKKETKLVTKPKLSNEQLRVLELKELSLQQQTPAKMMKAINDTLSSKVQLNKINFIGNRMTIDAQTASSSRIDDFQKKLILSHMVEKVELISVSKGKPIVFKVDVQLKNQDDLIKKIGETNKSKYLVDPGNVSKLFRKFVGLMKQLNMKLLKAGTLPETEKEYYNQTPMSIVAIGTLEQFTEFSKMLHDMNSYVTIDECKFLRKEGVNKKGLYNLKFTFSIYVKKVKK
jgi:Tfp pilus assembly protein PilO